jgi:hypothetical protein
MARRALPAVLAFAGLCADLAGGHALARVALLGAVPAAFVLVLDCYGDALAARCGGVRPLLAAFALVLLVLSAALRSPAVVGGVPRASVSALALACLLAAAAAVLSIGRRPAIVRVASAPDEPARGDSRAAA